MLLHQTSRTKQVIKRVSTCLAIAVCVTVAAWVAAVVATGFSDPIYQSIAVRNLICGPPGFRNRKEAEVIMAMFHLRQAVRRESSRKWLFESWDDVVTKTGDYTGPHLKGTLSEAFPLLRQPLDPWGNPWVYRLKAVGQWQDGSFLIEVTFGSPGPDHRESPRQAPGDDLLQTVAFTRIAPGAVPPGTPRGTPRTITVPTPLW